MNRFVFLESILYWKKTIALSLSKNFRKIGSLHYANITNFF